MGHCFLFSPTGLAVLGCNSLGLEIPSYGQRDQSYKTGRIGGAGIGNQGAVPQRALGSTMVPNPLNSLGERLSSMDGIQIPSGRKVQNSVVEALVGLASKAKGLDPRKQRRSQNSHWKLMEVSKFYNQHFFNC